MSPYRHRQYMILKARSAEHRFAPLSSDGQLLVAKLESFLAAQRAR
jgi:hypothetical protein